MYCETHQPDNQIGGLFFTSRPKIKGLKVIRPKQNDTLFPIAQPTLKYNSDRP